MSYLGGLGVSPAKTTPTPKEQGQASAAELSLNARREIEEVRNLLRSGLKEAKRLKYEIKRLKSSKGFPPFPFEEPPPIPDEIYEMSAVLKEARRYGGPFNRHLQEVQAALRLAKREYKVRFDTWYRMREAARRAQKDRKEESPKEENRERKDLTVCRIALNSSRYPGYCPNEFTISLTSDYTTLVIDYLLPKQEDIPQFKEARYISSRSEVVSIPLSKSEINELYDSLVYQICLRSIHEIFYVSSEVLTGVVFNGYVDRLNLADGHVNRLCIMTLHADREGFSKINLAQVDPKACFRGLKGIAAPGLHQLVPVAPVLQLNTTDKRFVGSKQVASVAGTNVAAIGWEDFEHLVREIFEKEFTKDGGEVKVTRASRDGGIDAVAFDPDPLRGGKIVIQAKRYTNTVDVSAVRDLYGTVLNEGANKGILVTTSSFGPDAFAFAKGKPLTLLEGNNLLHLLEKHGHRAYIDLAEARRLNPEPLARKSSTVAKREINTQTDHA
jgi:restriction system protein